MFHLWLIVTRDFYILQIIYNVPKQKIAVMVLRYGVLRTFSESRHVQTAESRRRAWNGRSTYGPDFFFVITINQLALTNESLISGHIKVKRDVSIENTTLSCVKSAYIYCSPPNSNYQLTISWWLFPPKVVCVSFVVSTLGRGPPFCSNPSRYKQTWRACFQCRWKKRLSRGNAFTASTHIQEFLLSHEGVIEVSERAREQSEQVKQAQQSRALRSEWAEWA